MYDDMILVYLNYHYFEDKESTNLISGNNKLGNNDDDDNGDDAERIELETIVLLN